MVKCFCRLKVRFRNSSLTYWLFTHKWRSHRFRSQRIGSLKIWWLHFLIQLIFFVIVIVMRINYFVCFHPLVYKEIVGCSEVSFFELNFITFHNLIWNKKIKGIVTVSWLAPWPKNICPLTPLLWKPKYFRIICL